MSLSDCDYLRLSDLIHRFEEGLLSGSELMELESILLKNPDARRYTVERLGLSAALCFYADESQAAGGNSAEENQLIQFSRHSRRQIFWLRIAAGLAVCALGLTLLMGGHRGIFKPEVRDNGCAVLVEAVETEWAAGSIQNMQCGMSIPAGLVSLNKGLARLEFYSGASLTLEGPGELEIISVNEVRSVRGQIRVHVPPQAKGFKVGAPGCDVVDLGTEFGLRFNESGKPQIDVFDGEVELTPFRESKLSLKAGTGWDAKQGVRASGSNAQDSYADIAAIREKSKSAELQRFHSWRTKIQEWTHDPRTLLAYTFEPTSDSERTLQNQIVAPPKATNGSIVGAKWVQGRWENKRGLEFKGVGDRVRLAVEGNHDAVTLCTWVRIGGLDRKYNGLFLSDGWKTGAVHWHIPQDGKLTVGVKDARKLQGVMSEQVFTTKTFGVWYHLAVTVDLRTGKAAHFVNGRRLKDVLDTAIPVELKIRIGPAELGNWGLPSTDNPSQVRNFNGVMDEFFLFNAALSDAEIFRLYQIGSPE
jgi:hypothetical protein